MSQFCCTNLATVFCLFIGNKVIKTVAVRSKVFYLARKFLAQISFKTVRKKCQNEMLSGKNAFKSSS